VARRWVIALPHLLPNVAHEFRGHAVIELVDIEYYPGRRVWKHVIGFKK
jgi:hypothetical protein